MLYNCCSLCSTPYGLDTGTGASYRQYTPPSTDNFLNSTVRASGGRCGFLHQSPQIVDDLRTVGVEIVIETEDVGVHSRYVDEVCPRNYPLRSAGGNVAKLR